MQFSYVAFGPAANLETPRDKYWHRTSGKLSSQLNYTRPNLSWYSGNNVIGMFRIYYFIAWHPIPEFKVNPQIRRIFFQVCKPCINFFCKPRMPYSIGWLTDRNQTCISRRCSAAL